MVAIHKEGEERQKANLLQSYNDALEEATKNMRDTLQNAFENAEWDGSSDWLDDWDADEYQDRAKELTQIIGAIISSESESLANLTGEELEAKMKGNTRPPQVVIIDSINYMPSLTIKTVQQLLKNHPNKLFILNGHAKGEEPKGEVGSMMRYHADVKIRVEGKKAFFSSRFADTEHGNEPYVIWAEAANEYWADKV